MIRRLLRFIAAKINAMLDLGLDPAALLGN